MNKTIIATQTPVSGASPQFKESLPTSCPPNEAVEETLKVIRLAKAQVPSDELFLSHAALKKTVKGDLDLCHQSSCSVFVAADNDGYGASIRKLPKFKKYFTHAFFLNIDNQSGKCKINTSSGHVDLWMYRSFDPVAAVYHVEALQ